MPWKLDEEGEGGCGRTSCEPLPPPSGMRILIGGAAPQKAGINIGEKAIDMAHPQ